MLTNEQEHKLLQTAPIELLTSEKYQNSIKKVVYIFFKKGFFRDSQPEDIIQDLNIVFLKRMFTLQRNYDPEFSKLVTYFERAVYNRCLELLKLKKNQVQNKVPIADYHIGNTNNQGVKTFLLEKEQKLIRDYLKLYPKNKEKLLICLKIYARIAIKVQDIKQYFPKVPSLLLEEVLAQFREYTDLSDQVAFQNIIVLVNGCEQKNVSADSLRRWADEQIKAIVMMLTKHTKHVYDKESLKNLLKVLSEPPFSEGEGNVFKL